jgi:hypothetical protein
MRATGVRFARGHLPPNKLPSNASTWLRVRSIPAGAVRHDGQLIALTEMAVAQTP